MDDMCKILLQELDIAHLRGRSAPKRSADLVPLIGYDIEVLRAPRLSKDVSWAELLPYMPRTLRWLKSPQAFVPPKHWPSRLGAYLDNSLQGRYVPTPLDWALDFCPQPWEFFGRSCPHGKLPQKFLFEYPNVGLISLAAHGYPLTSEEEVSAIEAYRLLLSSPTFLIWLLNIDVTHLSHERLAKGLNYSPLSYHAQRAMALLGLRPLDQLWSIEPRAEWMRRSVRAPCVALKLPPDLASVSERQYQFLCKLGVTTKELDRISSTLKKRLLATPGAIVNG